MARSTTARPLLWVCARPTKAHKKIRAPSHPTYRACVVNVNVVPPITFSIFFALAPPFALLVLSRTPLPPLIMSDPGCRLFVGNLSWNTTDESMRMAFEDGAGVPGSVLDSKVILDRETGRSRYVSLHSLYWLRVCACLLACFYDCAG